MTETYWLERAKIKWGEAARIVQLEGINKVLLEACEWAYGELEERDCSREDVLEVLAKAIRRGECEMNDWLSNVEKGNKKIRERQRLHSETNSERMARVLRELADYIIWKETNMALTREEIAEFVWGDAGEKSFSPDAKELLK